MLRDGGLLNNRIKYVKRKHNGAQNRNDKKQKTTNEAISTAEEDLFFLKTMDIGSVDKETIARKLNSTRVIRMEMMKKDETDLREQFPFIFSSPEIVSYHSMS